MVSIVQVSSPVKVIDGVFTDSELGTIDSWFSTYSGWAFSRDGKHTRAITSTLGQFIWHDQWKGQYSIFQDMKNILDERLNYGHTGTHSVPLFERAFVNCFRMGDTSQFHTDSKLPTSVTYIIYTNRVWDISWGAPTMFADDQNEIIDCVTPKPGRLIIFPGNVKHVGIAPTRLHQGYGRFSVAFQDPYGNYNISKDMRNTHIEKKKEIKRL
jgi:hypothetical protein